MHIRVTTCSFYIAIVVIHLTTFWHADADLQGAQQLIQALDAALIRLRLNGDYLAIMEASQSSEGPNVDVLRFYTPYDGAEDQYPFPEKDELTTIMETIVITKNVHVCVYIGDGEESASRQAQLLRKVWEKIGENYNEIFNLTYIVLDPILGSEIPLEKVNLGRKNGGCDMSAAPAAIGGFFGEGKTGLPRSTGPNGAFLVSLPTQGTTFAVLTKEESNFKTFREILNSVNSLHVCYNTRNGGVTRTFFCNSAKLISKPFNAKSACETEVLDGNSNTIFFSEFESIETSATAGLRRIRTGVTTPIGYHVKKHFQ